MLLGHEFKAKVLILHAENMQKTVMYFCDTNIQLVCHIQKHS